jgi:hypothetical protein
LSSLAIACFFGAVVATASSLALFDCPLIDLLAIKFFEITCLAKIG